MVDVVLQVVLVLATSIWVGGLVAIAVVARVAARTLRAADRVQFFRGLGRAYGPLGGVALVVALTAGALLLLEEAANGLAIACAVVAGVLVAITVVAVAQARRMTRLRARAVSHAEDPQLREAVRRGAMRAAALRAVMAALSVALVLLGVLAGA